MAAFVTSSTMTFLPLNSGYSFTCTCGLLEVTAAAIAEMQLNLPSERQRIVLHTSSVSLSRGLRATHRAAFWILTICHPILRPLPAACIDQSPQHPSKHDASILSLPSL